MATIYTTYLGDLRTEAEHLKSGIKIITDAPVDNQGKGEAFSPSDLLAAALGSCMMTIMGISARTHHIDIEGMTCDITKIMSAEPRQVAEVVVSFQFPKAGYTDKEKAILERAAYNCPVILSLNPSLKKTVHFGW